MDGTRTLPRTCTFKRVRFIRNAKGSAGDNVWLWYGFFLLVSWFRIPPYYGYHHWISYESSRADMVPLYFISRKLCQDRENSTLDSISLPLISSLLVIFCLQLEKTTSGVLKIHADTPALSFILIGLCLFQQYEFKKSNKFLFLTSLSLSLGSLVKVANSAGIILSFHLLIPKS